MSNVLNYFSQADSTGDNALTLGGTVTTGTENLKKTFLNVKMTDISTASSVYVVSPVAGTFSKIYSVVDGTTATAAAAITTEINTVAVTDGAFDIANGAVAGEVDSGTPTALNTLAVGDVLEVITDGASTNTVAAVFTIEITRS